MSRRIEEAGYSSQERSPIRGVSHRSRISPATRRVLPEQIPPPNQLPPRQRLLPVRIPQLNPHQVLLVPGLMGELQAIARGSAELSAFQPNQIMGTAHILVRYGVQSLGAPKQIDKQARCYLFEDLRRREQMASPDQARDGRSLRPHFRNGNF